MLCRCGAAGNPSCGGGNSDPVMYGFAGRSFNFIGDVGKTYNIISTQNLQVLIHSAAFKNICRLDKFCVTNVLDN